MAYLPDEIPGPAPSVADNSSGTIASSASYAFSAAAPVDAFGTRRHRPAPPVTPSHRNGSKHQTLESFSVLRLFIMPLTQQ